MVEAAGAVHSIQWTQFALLEFGLELVLERFLTRGIAAAAGVVRVALVAADEEVAFKRGHAMRDWGLGVRDWRRTVNGLESPFSGEPKATVSVVSQGCEISS